jgi:tetratricopeptide (TPR) repeat protein
MPQIPDNPIYVLIFTMPVIIGIILFYKGLKLELFLIFWIMLTLAPSLLTLYSQVISPIGERYLYLPSVGFSIIVGLALITTIHSRKVMTIVFIGMIIVYATLTYERLTVWENEEFLWHDTMKKSPNLGTPYANYGAMLLKRSQYAEARDIFLQSLTKQTTTQTKSIIFNLLGSAEMGLNNNTKAEEYLLKSLELSPDNIRTYNTLGVLYINLSENDNISDKESAYYLDKAITNFEKALKISPNFIQPIFHLGLCYFKRGEHKKAEGFFYSVLKLQQTGSLAEKSLYFLKLIQSTKLKQ